MSLGAHEPSGRPPGRGRRRVQRGRDDGRRERQHQPPNWMEIFYGCRGRRPGRLRPGHRGLVHRRGRQADRLLVHRAAGRPRGPRRQHLLDGPDRRPACSARRTATTGPSGTSMASPHVAGVVALVLSAGITDANSNGLLADDVKAHLCANTSPAAGMATTDPRYPNWYGCGIVDADKALVDNPPPGSGGGGRQRADGRRRHRDHERGHARPTSRSWPTTPTPTASPDGHGGHRPAARHRHDQPERHGPLRPGRATTTAPTPSTTPSPITTARTDTGSVAVTVTAVNDPPVAVDDTATTPEDASTLIDVLANDTDPDSDPLTLESVGQPGPRHDRLEAGQVRYTPAANYAGPDTFGYTRERRRGRLRHRFRGGHRDRRSTTRRSPTTTRPRPPRTPRRSSTCAPTTPTSMATPLDHLERRQPEPRHGRHRGRPGPVHAGRQLHRAGFVRLHDRRRRRRQCLGDGLGDGHGRQRPAGRGRRHSDDTRRTSRSSSTSSPTTPISTAGRSSSRRSAARATGRRRSNPARSATRRRSTTSGPIRSPTPSATARAAAPRRPCR